MTTPHTENLQRVVWLNQVGDSRESFMISLGRKRLVFENIRGEFVCDECDIDHPDIKPLVATSGLDRATAIANQYAIFLPTAEMEDMTPSEGAGPLRHRHRGDQAVHRRAQQPAVAVFHGAVRPAQEQAGLCHRRPEPHRLPGKQGRPAPGEGRARLRGPASHAESTPQAKAEAPTEVGPEVSPAEAPVQVVAAKPKGKPGPKPKGKKPGPKPKAKKSQPTLTVDTDDTPSPDHAPI